MIEPQAIVEPQVIVEKPVMVEQLAIVEKPVIVKLPAVTVDTPVIIMSQMIVEPPVVPVIEPEPYHDWTVATTEPIPDVIPVYIPTVTPNPYLNYLGDYTLTDYEVARIKAKLSSKKLKKWYFEKKSRINHGFV